MWSQSLLAALSTALFLTSTLSILGTMTMNAIANRVRNCYGWWCGLCEYLRVIVIRTRYVFKVILSLACIELWKVHLIIRIQLICKRGERKKRKKNPTKEDKNQKLKQKKWRMLDKHKQFFWGFFCFSSDSICSHWIFSIFFGRHWKVWLVLVSE